MNINREQINLRIQEIQQNLEKIKRLANLSDRELLEKEDNIAALKYYILESIEATASICSHLNAKVLKRAPEGYADCFTNLTEKEIINEDLAKRLIQMANFRNLLIHHYYRIKDEKIIRYARQDLEDFNDFIIAVSNFSKDI